MADYFKSLQTIILAGGDHLAAHKLQELARAIATEEWPDDAGMENQA